MAHFQDQEKAIKLRKEGKSYSQIKEVLGTSKSTLSNWLHDYPLPPERMKELRDHNEKRIERFRETMRQKRQSRIDTVYKNQKKLLGRFKRRDLFLAGLFLYWGEGTKTRYESISLTNTDPGMIIFYIKWLTESLNVPKEKIRIRLQLYKDMDQKVESTYWSKILGIPLTQFRKPQIKESSIYRLTHKGRFTHGTCDVIVDSVPLAEKVLSSIKVLHDKYTK